MSASAWHRGMEAGAAGFRREVITATVIDQKVLTVPKAKP